MAMAARGAAVLRVIFFVNFFYTLCSRETVSLLVLVG